jgi:hypothetical protein
MPPVPRLKRKLVEVPSPAEVAAARTPQGGWARETLAKWGVSWPPPKGWRSRLVAEYSERYPSDPAQEDA